MKFLVMILILMLVSCVPDANFSGNGKVSFASKFAGFFPQDLQDEVLPIWKGSLENIEPVALEAIKSFDVQFQGVFAFELTEVRNGLRVRELRGSGLVKNNLQIVISETLEHVAVGVFDMSVAFPNIAPANSVGAKLELAIAAALDAKFVRDRF
jgi:hypothetical protein